MCRSDPLGKGVSTHGGGESLSLGFPVLQLVLHGHVLEGFLIGKSLTLGFPVLQVVLQVVLQGQV